MGTGGLAPAGVRCSAPRKTRNYSKAPHTPRHAQADPGQQAVRFRLPVQPDRAPADARRPGSRARRLSRRAASTPTARGSLVLTDDGRLQARIADPRHKLEKGYWVQVEGSAAGSQLEALRRGVDLGDFVTRPASVDAIAEPAGALAPRSAHPRAPGDPDCLARHAHPGGTQPPGAADDRQGRPAHPAARPLPGRPLDPRRASPRASGGRPRAAL